MSYNDEQLKLFLKVLLENDWDILYGLTRFCKLLFSGLTDDSNRAENPSDSSENSRLLSESVISRSVRTMAAPFAYRSPLCRRQLYRPLSRLPVIVAGPRTPDPPSLMQLIAHEQERT
ncbi:hypothetical protein Vafri_12004 [Volvox africanus]|uniref:Uncharacterized protein n=1 Tax=Volvox africanus TaxID=51714 RepID=A0A8J4B9C7_9CHLO|nr:hypothetical protein Vafri_12004 [Volvox africanus]